MGKADRYIRQSDSKPVEGAHIVLIKTKKALITEYKVWSEFLCVADTGFIRQ